MRFSGLHLHGFGLFHNLRIQDLSPRLTLFLGLNESGKSTLLSFIRAVLYGFPDGRSVENPYPPLAGGRHGGSITLVLEDGQVYTLSRYAGPKGGKAEVYGPQPGGTSLDRLLGPGNKTLFRNVFAFRLEELQSMETLSAEAVGEALFSAGAGVDPGALSKLKAGLDKREGELFRPRGPKTQIHAILTRLSVIAREKSALYGSVAEYDRLRSGAVHLSNQVKALEERRAGLSAGLKETEQWIRIWPEWIGFCVAGERLKELEEVDHFPPDGPSRLDGLKARLTDTRNELDEKEVTRGRLESELSLLKTDPSILEHASSVKALRRDQGRFEAVGQELVALEHERVKGEERLKDVLSRLGPLWDDERIQDFDLSIATREEVRHHREGLRQAEDVLAGKRESLHQALSNRKLAEGVVGNLTEPSVKDPDRLLGMKAACRRLRDLAGKMDALRKQALYLQEHLDELKAEKGMLQAAEAREGGSPGVLPVLVGLGGAVLLALYLGVTGDWRPAWPVGGFVLLSGLLLWLARRANAAREERRAEELRRRGDELDARISAVEEKRTNLAGDTDVLHGEIMVCATGLSLGETPPSEVLERMEQDLEEQLRHLDRWKAAVERLSQAVEREQGAQKEWEEAEALLGEAREAWEGWLKERALNPLLTPDGALETFSLIESARDQLRHVNQFRRKTAALEEESGAYLGLAAEILEARKGSGAEEEEVRAAVARLIQEFEEADQAAQKRVVVVREIEANRLSVERLGKRVSELEGEIRALLAAGGAADEEGFRERAAVYARRMTLKGEMARAEENMRRLPAAQGEMKTVHARLSRTDLHALESERAGAEQELKKTEEMLERLKGEQVRLEEQARRLTDDERIASLREEEEGLAETLAPLAEEWVVVRLAQRLLRMAMARYERDRQPGVIRRAAAYFNQMTLGRYPSLVAPMGENRIEVVSRDNTRKEIDQLSRGTAEELYLSLRFGFIREFSKRSEPLPVVMDEILVNFDPPRARAAATAILDLSRKHQILFFTCHPEIADLFKGLDPEVPVLEISEGKVKRMSNDQWSGERRE
jgi:uncharacterized protein YhaN